MKNFSGTKYLLSIVLVFGLTSSFLYKAEVGFSEEKKLLMTVQRLSASQRLRQINQVNRRKKIHL